MSLDQGLLAAYYGALKESRRGYRNVRSHCQKCGRFTTHLYTPPGPDINGEYPDSIGICKVHGEVHESWPA